MPEQSTDAAAAPTNLHAWCSCVIRGCVPKKLLVYGAHVADELSDAAGVLG